MKLLNLLKKVVGKKPDEEKERERINFIKELLASQVLVKPTHSDWARAIAHNYSVDSIVVSRKDGSVLMSNTDKAFERAVKTSSLYEYTRSEFPKAEMLLVKDGDDYNIVYPHGDMIYVLKSSASLSPTETEKIVEQLRAGLNGQNAPRETALAVS